MLPALSIIVPSLNQAAFLDECLQSIIGQHYPKTEIIVIDGGSTDGSLDIIKKYEARLSYWVSEPDRGQSHAINKGLEKATGEWVAWMNSDDCYLPGAFHHIFGNLPWQSADFIFGNTCCGSDVADAVLYEHPEKQKNSLFQILKFFYSVNHIIPSQSVFIRREIIERVGVLDETLEYCMDLDWYSRIFLATSRRIFYTKTLSFFRLHIQSKTVQKNNGWEESIMIAQKYLPHLNASEQKALKQYMVYAEWIRGAKMVSPSMASLFSVALRYRNIAFKSPGFRILVLEKINGFRNLRLNNKA